jgi:hypothetical protein
VILAAMFRERPAKPVKPAKPKKPLSHRIGIAVLSTASVIFSVLVVWAMVDAVMYPRPQANRPVKLNVTSQGIRWWECPKGIATCGDPGPMQVGETRTTPEGITFTRTK